MSHTPHDSKCLCELENCLHKPAGGSNVIILLLFQTQNNNYTYKAISPSHSPTPLSVTVTATFLYNRQSMNQTHLSIRALIYDDALRACTVSTVTADRTGKFVLLTYSLTASHCSAEAYLARAPSPHSR